MTRSEARQAMVRGLGAVPVVADALDPGAGAVLMTELCGASNASAGRELGRQPAHPGWRQEFVT